MTMNGRQRFINTISYRDKDRPPLFEDGIRNSVLRIWRSQGLGRHEILDDRFTLDYRLEIEPELEPRPAPSRWPTSLEGVKKFSSRLDPNDARRLPDGWEDQVAALKERSFPVILRVHRGYFLTMGVRGWHRFTEAIQLLVDDPKLVHAWMELQAEFVCALLEKILGALKVEAVLFSEPIGGNNGPLISPAMYSTFVLSSYAPIIQVLKQNGVNTLIYRTYANTRALLPSVVKAGFNCLWACECNPQAMDYKEIRNEFGKDLRLIGGIDSDTLRSTPDEINRSIMEVVPPLLEDGGYIPLADGRVRDDVPFQNYLCYRKLLETVTGIQ
jgi:hypothetical protein